jgi:DNA ligase-1
MLVEKRNGKLYAYSRQGKPITSVPHIMASLEDMPEGTILDGELYHHGTALQTIASWVKRDQPESANLTYVIYDQITDEPFIRRYSKLRALGVDRDSTTLAPTVDVKNTPDFTVSSYLEQALSRKFEGLIIRHGKTGYEVGYRSQSLVKVKEVQDAEFKCIDVNPSKDNWGILTVLTDDGKEFGVSAPGTIEQKRDVLYNADKYLGKYVTVEYSQLTKDGIPFHPVAVRWRGDL